MNVELASALRLNLVHTSSKNSTRTIKTQERNKSYYYKRKQIAYTLLR